MMPGLYNFTPVDADTTRISACSSFTGKVHKIDVKLPYSVFRKKYHEWENGKLIQDAFPELSPEEREIIKTGVTEEEWKEVLGE